MAPSKYETDGYRLEPMPRCSFPFSPRVTRLRSPPLTPRIALLPTIVSFALRSPRYRVNISTCRFPGFVRQHESHSMELVSVNMFLERVMGSYHVSRRTGPRRAVLENVSQWNTRGIHLIQSAFARRHISLISLDGLASTKRIALQLTYSSFPGHFTAAGWVPEKCRGVSISHSKRNVSSQCCNPLRRRTMVPSLESQLLWTAQ